MNANYNYFQKIDQTCVEFNDDELILIEND